LCAGICCTGIAEGGWWASNHGSEPSKWVATRAAHSLAAAASAATTPAGAALAAGIFCHLYCKDRKKSEAPLVEFLVSEELPTANSNGPLHRTLQEFESLSQIYAVVEGREFLEGQRRLSIRLIDPVMQLPEPVTHVFL